MDRLTEIMALADAGDDDIRLQVEGEIALMPETRARRRQRELEICDEIADGYAAPTAALDQASIDELANELDF